SDVEALVELVASHLCQVIPARVEEEGLEQAHGVVLGWRIARAEPAIELNYGVFLRMGAVLINRGAYIVVVAFVDAGEKLLKLLVCTVADGAKENRNGYLPLAVYFDRHNILVRGLEL